MDFVILCWAYCRSVISARTSDERGASLIEYALLLVLIAVLCIGAITVVGDSTNTKLSSSGSLLN